MHVLERDNLLFLPLLIARCNRNLLLTMFIPLCRQCMPILQLLLAWKVPQRRWHPWIRYLTILDGAVEEYLLNFTGHIDLYSKGASWLQCFNVLNICSISRPYEVNLKIIYYYHHHLSISGMFYLQQMAPAKQAKVIREFQKQSAQMDMTVRSWFYFKIIKMAQGLYLFSCLYYSGGNGLLFTCACRQKWCQKP